MRDQCPFSPFQKQLPLADVDEYEFPFFPQYFPHFLCIKNAQLPFTLVLNVTAPLLTWVGMCYLSEPWDQQLLFHLPARKFTGRV